MPPSVVQTLDSASHRINHYPGDKCQGNQLRASHGTEIKLSNWWKLHVGPGVSTEWRIKLSREQSSKRQTKTALFVGLKFGFVPIPFHFLLPV